MEEVGYTTLYKKQEKIITYKPYRSTDKRAYMSMDYMFCTLIIVAILVIINSTFIAYLYLSYKYKTIDKFFMAWVTSSTMILIMWFVEGLYLYLTN